MTKKFFLAAAAAAVLILGASGASAAHLTEANASAPNSAAKVNENASDLGKERAERNSRGGDREKGGFGPAQSEAARAPGPYGQTLDLFVPRN